MIIISLGIFNIITSMILKPLLTAIITEFIITSTPNMVTSLYFLNKDCAFSAFFEAETL